MKIHVAVFVVVFIAGCYGINGKYLIDLFNRLLAIKLAVSGDKNGSFRWMASRDNYIQRYLYGC